MYVIFVFFFLINEKQVFGVIFGDDHLYF